MRAATCSICGEEIIKPRPDVPTWWVHRSDGMKGHFGEPLERSTHEAVPYAALGRHT